MNNKLPPARIHYEALTDSAFPFHYSHHYLHTSYPVHWHEWYELSYVRSGTAVHIVNGQRYYLKPGSMFLLTPVDFHELHPYACTPLEIMNIHFEEHCLAPSLQSKLAANTQLWHTDWKQGDRPMECEVIRLCGEIDARGPWAWEAASASLTRILIDLMRACMNQHPVKEEQQVTAVHPSIRQALAYMHRNFRKRLSLDEVAREAGLSAGYFSHIFHQELGQSYQGFLLQLRLQFASSLLTSSELSVTEVSGASGFHTLPYFQHKFKDKYGMTPGAYRATFAASVTRG